ncbi:MAG: hypothetical protein WCI86_00105 [Actinomycetota bacterium]|jgi:hypothetical protein
MKLFGALVVGVATGTAAIFLHLFAPPFGITISIIGTFLAIWALGRTYGKRFYKAIGALGWFVIFWRGASFGVGKEIFIQGNSLGNAFLLLSFIAIIAATAMPAN